MKKIFILVLVFSICCAAVFAAGEIAYLEASQELASGDVSSAKMKFAQAANELTGTGKESAEFMADFLDKMSSSTSESKIIKSMSFVGEVLDENGVHHLYYDRDANSVFHSRIKDGATPSELVNELGLNLNKQKVTSDAEGYLSEASAVVGNIKSRTRMWACESTTHIVTETFSGASDMDAIFSKVSCGGAGGDSTLTIILIVVAAGGVLAFLYFKTNYLDGLKKIIARR